MSGRTYPVEVRYREPEEDADQTDAIGDAVDELLREPPGRHPRVPVRRARDPRHRGGARGPLQQRRDPAAVRAPVHGRAATRVEAAQGPARRARHQRGRDVADRARHPLRRGPRHGPHLPLQRASEGAAAADRADLAGLRRPAQGPLRPRRRRHRDPALQRGELRGAPALHRPRDPAHEPRRGDPADGGDRPRRHRGLPVPGPAGPAPGARRHRAAAGAGRARRERPHPHAARTPARRAADRPADGPDGARGRRAGLRGGSDRDRRGALDPGRARAARRPAGPGRPGARAPRRRELRLPRLLEPVALPARAARGAVREPVPQAVQGRVPALPADPRVAGPRGADPPGRQGRRDQEQPHAGRAGADPPGDPRRAAVAPRAQGRGAAGVHRRPQRALRAVAGLAA